jgi:hypothetical protein
LSIDFFSLPLFADSSFTFRMLPMRKVRRAPFGPGLLAWPSPPGPLGWQRLRGQGRAERVHATAGSALEAGGASPDNARRTGPGPATRSRRSAHPVRRSRPGRGAGGRGSGIRREPQAAGHRGAVRGLPPRRRACVRRTRRSGPPRNGETPRLNPRRDGGSPSPLIPSHLLASAPRCSRPGPQAWRAGGAPLKPYRNLSQVSRRWASAGSSTLRPGSLLR